MLHDLPMDILWLGVLLERIGQTARILDMHHYVLDDGGGQHQIVQTALWLSLLRTCSGFEAFMRQHKGRVSGPGAVAFLLFEERFPRSLRYCVRSALGLVRRIWPEPSPLIRAEALERLVALDTWLEEQQDDLLPQRIHDLLTHVVDEVGLVCAAVRGGISGETGQSQSQSQTSGASSQAAGPAAAQLDAQAVQLDVDATPPQ
jgi:uncharacterized alpha-E superfamily protein